MKKIFVDSETGRLRAGWRILLFVVIFLGITAIGMVVARAILGGLPKLSLQQFTVMAITATLAVFLARKYLDKKSFVSLGLKFDMFAVLDIVAGIVNSALVMATMFFMFLWLSLIHI